MDENTTSPALIERLRGLVRHYREKHHHKTALFWADKVASLSKYEVQDVYNFAQCMYSVGEYERAALFIKGKELHDKYTAFRYLAAKCYAEAKEWQQALDLLEDSTFQVIPKELMTDSEGVPGIPTSKEMQSSILLLKGDIYEAKDTRQYAAQCYEEALLTDVFCYEAYDRLIAHHLLFPQGERDIIKSLPLSKQCRTDEEKELVTFLYGTKIKKYGKPLAFEIPPSLDNLHENLEVATSLAERHYYSCEFRASYKITSGILRSDPYHSQCLPLHVAILVVLKRSNELFYLSHRLVKLYPGNAISWYAVGCYYLLQPKKQEMTRRYLLKATLIDKMFGPAWLALGHSFAMEGEHDQAMAAYFTATQLMRGSHLPYLYSGIEYSVTNNPALTDKFFNVALVICPDDPHTLHEIGVANYNMNNYSAALKHFNKALDILKQNQEEISSEEWEALLNNLGHVHRKMKNYEMALKFHRQALILAPQCAQTYASIGFALSHMGKYEEALENLHKALGLRRDDVFTVNLIEIVITQFAESEPPLPDADPLDDNRPPPPTFSRGSGGQSAEVEMDESKMPDSSTVWNYLPGDEPKAETETPVQDGEKKSQHVVEEEEGAGAFQTPEEYLLARPLVPHALKNLKEVHAHARSRRVVSSPAPVPIDFTREDTPIAADRSTDTPTVPTQKMLTLESSESGDDGGLLGLGPAAGPWGPSSVETWSTRVLTGGGGGFDSPAGGDIPGVSDSVIMMLDDSEHGVFESPAQLITGGRAPADGGARTPVETRSQAMKRSRDDNESSDMEMDDTLD